MKKIITHSLDDFKKMEIAGKLAAQTLDMIGEFVKPGISTNELDKICHDFTIQNNAIPAPLNYKGFPKSICTSVNHVVCHGIPDDYKLQDGDIISIDVTSIVDGWHGDSCRTYFVGDSFIKNPKTIKAKRLTKVTYNAMMLAISAVKPGERLSIIGQTIQEYVQQYGFGIVQDFCGHGVGKTFHTEPMVPHYYAKDISRYSDEIILKEGMFFTIEPMINAGRYDVIVSQFDNWTVTTRDKSLSAQFEHTIGVTSNGAVIFTKSQNGTDFPKILEDFKL